MDHGEFKNKRKIGDIERNTIVMSSETMVRPDKSKGFSFFHSDLYFNKNIFFFFFYHGKVVGHVDCLPPLPIPLHK